MYKEIHRCINIDWLQLFGRLINEESIIAIVEKCGYIVKDNDRGTRHFAKWLTIYLTDNPSPFLQICYAPMSVKGPGSKGIFEPGSATIQLCNKFCYIDNPVELLYSVCMQIGFVYKSISRIDICYDFLLFDNGLSPQSLLRGFYNCKYLKVKQLKTRGVATQYGVMEHDYAAWGAERSKVGIKLYNKSKELNQVHDKPYIRDVWALNGLGNKKNVWRLEFSIKSDGRDYIHTDTGELIKVNLKEVSTKEGILLLFQVLCNHYFRFKEAGTATRKTNCKDIPLIVVPEEAKTIKPIKITLSKDVDRKRKMLINTMYEELSDHDLSSEDRILIEKAMFLFSTRYRYLPNLLTEKSKENETKKHGGDDE